METNATYTYLTNLYAGAGQFFCHSDHLGSASWITEARGEAIQHLQYCPFGEPLVDEHSSTSTYSERFTFTGKERDEETGYSYFGARYLDAALLTSWLSVDPMSDKYPSLSPYIYCAWNPVKLVDPDGCESIIPPSSEKNIQRLYREADYKLQHCKPEERESMELEIAEMKCEIQQLRESNQVYTIDKSTKFFKGGKHENAGGVISFNTQTNTVDIIYDGRFGALSHELKHAYQFEIGELTFCNNGNAGFAYDIYDELDSWNREWIFSGQQESVNSLQKKPAYQDLPSVFIGVNAYYPTHDYNMKAYTDAPTFQNTNDYYRFQGNTYHGKTVLTK